VSNIMPEPGRHGWAELFTLVDAIRNVAYNPGLAADDQTRRIRDLPRPRPPEGSS
jgi:hypothetical protein